MAAAGPLTGDSAGAPNEIRSEISEPEGTSADENERRVVLPGNNRKAVRSEQANARAAGKRHRLLVGKRSFECLRLR